MWHELNLEKNYSWRDSKKCIGMQEQVFLTMCIKNSLKYFNENVLFYYTCLFHKYIVIRVHLICICGICVKTAYISKAVLFNLRVVVMRVIWTHFFKIVYWELFEKKKLIRTYQKWQWRLHAKCVVVDNGRNKGWYIRGRERRKPQK